MLVLAIRFGDNDFSTLFHAMAEDLAKAFETDPNCPLWTDKEVLTKAVLSGVQYYYWTSYNNWTEESLAAASKLKPKVYLGTEVEEYCQSVDNWDNSETVLVFVDLQAGTSTVSFL